MSKDVKRTKSTSHDSQKNKVQWLRRVSQGVERYYYFKDILIGDTDCGSRKFCAPHQHLW